MVSTSADPETFADTELPEGLTLRRAHESLETVSSSTTTFRLLVTNRNTEIIDIQIKAGERIILVPPDDKTVCTVETFIIVIGSLCCLLPMGEVILRPRDYLVTRDLEAPVNLVARSDVTLLYITSTPFFHEISNNIQQLMRLAVDIEEKDGYTADHCGRIQKLSYLTATELGLPPRQLNLLDYGAYLHDVGKIKVPLSILQKPGKLDRDEWQIIQQHPSFGRELLEPTFMKEAGKIVEQHHERLDGSGYPFGLMGEEILPESYIVAVADTYDAMTTDRPYRKALRPEVAFAELERYSNIHYPAEVVRAFASAVEKASFKI